MPADTAATSAALYPPTSTGSGEGMHPSAVASEPDVGTGQRRGSSHSLSDTQAHDSGDASTGASATGSAASEAAVDHAPAANAAHDGASSSDAGVSASGGVDDAGTGTTTSHAADSSPETAFTAAAVEQ